MDNLDLQCKCPSEETIERMFQDWTASIPTAPVMFSASDHIGWQSPPFYTHPRGYKMCLIISYVPPNQEFTANYCSRPGPTPPPGLPHGCYVFLCSERGEFDNYLRFPIRLSLQLHVMKKDTNESHSITLHFLKKKVHVTKPPFYFEGATLLLRADKVKSYSIEDTLTFKITDVVTNALLPLEDDSEQDSD